MNTAPDRNKAKSGILTESDQDPDLNLKMSEARRYEYELRKEENLHSRLMKDKELGLIGRLTGDKNASTSICFFVIAICMTLATISTFAAYNNPAASEFWYKMIERCFAVALAFATFLFGRTSR